MDFRLFFIVFNCYIILKTWLSYYNIKKLLRAIFAYQIFSLYNGFVEKVNYEDLYPILRGILCFWDLGYTNYMPKDKFMHIEPFLDVSYSEINDVIQNVTVDIEVVKKKQREYLLSNIPSRTIFTIETINSTRYVRYLGQFRLDNEDTEYPYSFYRYEHFVALYDDVLKEGFAEHENKYKSLQDIAIVKCTSENVEMRLLDYHPYIVPHFTACCVDGCFIIMHDK